MLRSIIAIVVGFVTIGALSVGTQHALHLHGVLPHPGQPITDTGLLLLTLAYVAVYAVFGCWLAAFLAPNRPMLHALILGALGLLLNLFTAFSMRGQWPAWYVVLGVALTLPYAWIGGKLRELQLARGRPGQLAG